MTIANLGLQYNLITNIKPFTNNNGAMQMEDKSARKAEYLSNGNRHSLEHDREKHNTVFDQNLEITDVEIELEAKYKRRSLDILQAISDTTNVTLSNATRQAWKRYENQTAIKRYRPCSRILVEPLVRDPLQDLMNPGQQTGSGGNYSNVQKTNGSNMNRPIKTNRKRWWNEENIFSWIKNPLTGWTIVTNEPGTLRKRISSKDDLPIKVDSLSPLSSQLLDDSYVKVRRCCSDDDLSLVKEDITDSNLKKPMHERSHQKTLRRVQSRPTLRNHNYDLTPLLTPKSLIDKGEVDLWTSPPGRYQATVGLGISGIKVPGFSKQKSVENSQVRVEERLIDHPPCLPKISVDVSLDEGESSNWSSQNSPANESVVSATFSLLNYSSEKGTVSEKQHTSEIIKSSTPTSISSYESVRSLIQPFLDDDQCTTTLPSPANGEFPFIPARSAIGGSRYVLKDFQNQIFDRTHKGNTKTQKIDKEIDEYDLTFASYPRQPQYHVHRHNNQQHPNHPFPWTTYNIWCYHCTKKSCSRCGNRCCVLTHLLDLLALPDSTSITKGKATELPTLTSVSKAQASPTKTKLLNTPSAKKQAVQSLRTIMTSHPTGGTDVLDMFLKCSTCMQTVCSMCCGVCPEGLCGDLQCKVCKADPWAKCDWHL